MGEIKERWLGGLRSTAVCVSCALCSNCALHLDIVVGGWCSYPALGGTGAWPVAGVRCSAGAAQVIRDA